MAALCLSSHVVSYLDFRDIHIARAVSWDWYAVFGSREVEKQCLRSQGVPRQYRLRFWLAQARAASLCAPADWLATYRSSLAKSKFRTDNEQVSWFTLSQQPGLAGEIARDVTRTFPHRVLFRVKNGLGRRMLFNVLIALAVHEPKVGYCQGMNFVVAVALAVALGFEETRDNADEMALATNGLPPGQQDAIEADVFWLMVAFLNRFDMRELWRPGVPQLKLRIYQFERLMASKLPLMHAHFRSIGLAPDFFASQWFLTLMSYNMEMPQLVRVWDVLVLEGWKTIFKAGLAILAACETEVLQMSLEQLSNFFRHGSALCLSDADHIAAAFAAKISTRELADLESDYISHILFKRISLDAADPAANGSGRHSSAAGGAAAGASGPKAGRGPPPHEPSGPRPAFADDDVFVDRRLATIFKQEIDHLDSDTRNDFRYLRGKIEEAERLFAQKDAEFQRVAREYVETKTTLDELKLAKKKFSDQLFELTKAPPDQNYNSYLDKIESIDARIRSVSKKVEAAHWSTMQAQVEKEEIIEKKNAFSHQLRGVLEQNEHVKSQTIKSLWSQRSDS